MWLSYSTEVSSSIFKMVCRSPPFPFLGFSFLSGKMIYKKNVKWLCLVTHRQRLTVLLIFTAYIFSSISRFLCPLSLPPPHQNDCNVNVQSYSGNTALHSACGRGQVDTARLLLKNRADSSVKNYHNDTPAMVAKNKKVREEKINALDLWKRVFSSV